MTMNNEKRSLALAYCSFIGVIAVTIVFPLLSMSTEGWKMHTWTYFSLLMPINVVVLFASIITGMLSIKYGQGTEPASETRFPKIKTLINSIILLFALFLVLLFYGIMTSSGSEIYIDLLASLLSIIGILGVVAGIKYGQEIQPAPKVGFAAIGFFSAIAIILLVFRGALEIYPIYQALPGIIMSLVSVIGILGILTGIKYGWETKLARKIGFAALGVLLNSIILLFSLALLFIPAVITGEIKYQKNVTWGNYICVEGDSSFLPEYIGTFNPAYFDGRTKIYEQYGSLPWQKQRVDAGNLSPGQIVVVRLGGSCDYEWLCFTAEKIIILKKVREWRFGQYEGNNCSAALGTFP